MLIRHLTAGLDGAEPKTKGMPDPLSSGRREALEVKLHAWYAIYLGMLEKAKAERRAGSPRSDMARRRCMDPLILICARCFPQRSCSGHGWVNCDDEGCMLERQVVDSGEDDTALAEPKRKRPQGQRWQRQWQGQACQITTTAPQVRGAARGPEGPQRCEEQHEQRQLEQHQDQRQRQHQHQHR